jgi:hypothetical protein
MIYSFPASDLQGCGPDTTDPQPDMDQRPRPTVRDILLAEAARLYPDARPCSGHRDWAPCFSEFGGITMLWFNTGDDDTKMVRALTDTGEILPTGVRVVAWNDMPHSRKGRRMACRYNPE